ncbi:MAG: hypothetical protein ACPHRO_11870 [Nannocystaceae bacterium]
MTEAVLRPNELALAVSGLAGIIGFLLLPTIGGWLRIFLRFVESGRRLGSTPRLPGVSILVALGLTFALGFFAVAHIRAARLLREVTREAPVFNTTVSSIAVGVAVWLAYALLARQLRREVQRTRAHRRW